METYQEISLLFVHFTLESVSDLSIRKGHCKICVTKSVLIIVTSRHFIPIFQALWYGVGSHRKSGTFPSKAHLQKFKHTSFKIMALDNLFIFFGCKT